VTAVLGTAIMTDNMAGCEAIAVFGCDNLHHPVRVGFTHVWGGYPDNVNWVSLMNGIAVHPNRYALVECNRVDSSDDRLYLSLRDSYGIPDGNILIYNKGVGESGGRTFGIDNTGNFGEAPAGLVERQKAARLDNVLKQQNFMRKNPGVRYDDKFSMKVKK
jgi:hypothetical protein